MQLQNLFTRCEKCPWILQRIQVRIIELQDIVLSLPVSDTTAVWSSTTLCQSNQRPDHFHREYQNTSRNKIMWLLLNPNFHKSPWRLENMSRYDRTKRESDTSYPRTRSFFTLNHENIVPSFPRCEKVGDATMPRAVFRGDRLKHLVLLMIGWLAVSIILLYENVEAMRLRFALVGRESCISTMCCPRRLIRAYSTSWLRKQRKSVTVQQLKN